MPTNEKDLPYLLAELSLKLDRIEVVLSNLRDIQLPRLREFLDRVELQTYLDRFPAEEWPETD